MIGIREIEEARARIDEYVVKTPCAKSESFAQLTGARTYFKLENLQMTGSFKERGALNKILTLIAEERGRGVIAAPRRQPRAGRRLPCDAPGHPGDDRDAGSRRRSIKVQRTRDYGAEVVLHGANYDEAYARAAARSQAESGAVFVHPFDDDAVIAGQGTIGLELLEQNPYLDAVVVPVGGGGLICGHRASR